MNSTCFSRSSETLLVVGSMNQLSHFTSTWDCMKAVSTCSHWTDLDPQIPLTLAGRKRKGGTKILAVI